MTLGLSEVWFGHEERLLPERQPQARDAEGAAGPLRACTCCRSRRAYGFLKDALLLLKKHGLKDLHVLLTVSPVPLQVTQRPVDVMVANTYSQSGPAHRRGDRRRGAAVRLLFPEL